MLEIRDNNQQVAFKIDATIAAIYYQKRQNDCLILDALQTQYTVYEYTDYGKMPFLLIPAPKFDEILKRINYAEILKFEIPLYSDESSTNEALKATIRLLKDAEKQLRLGVAFTQIGNNFGYLHRLHFLASFLYISWI